MRRARSLGLLAAVALTAGACSSTLLREDVASAPGAASPGQVVEGAPAPGLVDGAGGPGTVETGSGPGATPGPGVTASPTAPAAVTAPGAPALELGVRGFTQGITADTIKVGIPVLAGVEAVSGLLGAANLRPGNNRLEGEALIADVNRRGGIHGRRLVADYHEVDFSNPAQVEAEVLAACNHFADDAKVFAILMVINPPPSFISCAAQRGVIVLDGSASAPDDEIINGSSPWFYAPSLASLSRVIDPLLDSVGGRGLISRGAKVGIFALDKQPFVRTAQNVVIPALERRGYVVAAFERVATTASIQNAVLRFRQAGVTHVVFVQESGIPVLLFMRQAEAQQLRPTYLLSSYDVPGYLLEGNVATEQIRGVQGIGWSPFFDVKASRFPSRPEEARCLDILTKGGEVNTDRQSHLTATFMCELVVSFEAIAEQAGPQLSTVSFKAGYHALGTSYRAVQALQTDFTTRADGVAAFRPLGWSAGCGCLDYLGPLEQLP